MTHDLVGQRRPSSQGFYITQKKTIARR